MRNSKTYLANIIENVFFQYGMFVKLKPVSISSNQEWIYRIKLKGCTKCKSVLAAADDVSLQLNLPILIFRQDDGLFCKINLSKEKNNDLYPFLQYICTNKDKKNLTVALGYDLTGNMTFDDLYQMPHLLCTGSTSSGKSVFLRSLLLCLTCALPVQDVNLIVFDVGGKTLSIFEGIPHLAHPIVKEIDQCVYVIETLYAEMERRLELSDEELLVLPALVCVIDEFVSLSERCKERFQEVISDILRRGRKVNLHIILAAQTSTKSALNIEINNITSRIAFKCASYHESLTAIGTPGAEKLRGNGEMLFRSNGMEIPERLQGPYISDADCLSIINQIKSEKHSFEGKFNIPTANPLTLTVINDSPKPTLDKHKSNPNEELAKIVMWVIGNNEVSVNSMKTVFRIGNRANAIIEKLCAWGIVSESRAKLPRNVIPHSADQLLDEVVSLLKDSGFTDEDITGAFQKRKTSFAAPRGLES